MKKIKNTILILFIAIVLFSCSTKSDNWQFKEVGTLLWVNEKMTDAAVKLAVKETLDNSSIIVSQVSWSPNDSSFKKNVKWYHDLSLESGKSLMLNIDWLENNRSGARGNHNFDNILIRNKFSKDIKELIDLYNPKFLTLGVEVNYYALTSPNGFREFIKMFNEIKKAIKENNPDIKIGLSFQLELLYGIHKDWNRIKSLAPLDAVAENLDYIGISTYPDVAIEVVDKPFYSINYLDSITAKYNKPIGITETAVSTTSYDDIERMNYIKSIYKKFNDLNLKFIVWGSIIDDPIQGDWKNRLGVIRSDGVYKPEFSVWKDENDKILKN